MDFLETAYFTSKQNRETPCMDVKIKVPQCLCCHYVYVYVCMYALSLQPTLFDLAS